MKIPTTDLQKKMERIGGMRLDRAPWEKAWREISDYFLPRRYLWLLTDKEFRSAQVRNRRLLDSTSVRALRTLATGMMNGITSPARPWFSLGEMGAPDDDQVAYDKAVWFEDSARVMLNVMAMTNFYNSIGILYLEWCAFGTAAMSIYEDDEDVFLCYNHPIGEFYLECDYNGQVVGFAREFTRTVAQAVPEFGLEAMTPNVQADWKAGGARLRNPVRIIHLRERNTGLVRKSAEYQDLYWQADRTDGTLLRASPVDESPTLTPRWEIYGSDFYGSSPCMDVLPDVLQLQQLIKRRAQGLDKMVSPPMLFNKQLANRPKSTLPGGETYVNGQDLQAGGRPLYQIQIPFGELNLDIAATKQAIAEGLFNDLFRMISNLDTVRSATEIDARREEKLVLLGPVLDRFFSEALTPAVRRIFNICRRAGLFRPEPVGIQNTNPEIYYTGVLSDAQRAVGTVPIERYLQVLGSLAPIYPDETLDVPNIEELLREYADAIGLSTKLQRSREEVATRREARDQERTALQAAEQGQALVGGAKQLSETDLGGGQSALQAMLGGGV
jgi:hypothetical protein